MPMISNDEFNEKTYKALLQKSKALRRMLKTLINKMFDEYDVVTYNIIKREFANKEIEYNK